MNYHTGCKGTYKERQLMPVYFRYEGNFVRLRKNKSRVLYSDSPKECRKLKSHDAFFCVNCKKIVYRLTNNRKVKKLVQNMGRFYER